MDIIDYIITIPLFKGLPRENHEGLAKIIVDKIFNRGQIIFSEGDEGNGFYVLISGRVKIFKLSPDGKQQILHIFSPGEPFGEVPVFAGERFPAHAEAIEESRVFFFPRVAFIDLITKNPSLALNMLAILSRRLYRFTTLIASLSLKEVPERLAAYLLYLCEMGGGTMALTLDISKGQLASLLGTIPETLSRVLSKMSREGLIQLDGTRRILICNREEIEKLAHSERQLL
ncbi:MAG: Crp/Fnr family transcriptional regulator [Thermodesulfobacteriota bacterium]|nr:Crp/Fnr family transcriptional regulator [Thermodesulfobacteriota bacterium]